MKCRPLRGRSSPLPARRFVSGASRRSTAQNQVRGFGCQGLSPRVCGASCCHPRHAFTHRLCSVTYPRHGVAPSELRPGRGGKCFRIYCIPISLWGSRFYHTFVCQVVDSEEEGEGVGVGNEVVMASAELKSSRHGLISSETVRRGWPSPDKGTFNRNLADEPRIQCLPLLAVGGSVR